MRKEDVDHVRFTLEDLAENQELCNHQSPLRRALAAHLGILAAALGELNFSGDDGLWANEDAALRRVVARPTELSWLTSDARELIGRLQQLLATTEPR